MEEDTWYHIVIVMDREADTVYVYKDNVLQPSCVTGWETVSDTAKLHFGARGRESASDPDLGFPGLLDDIRFYNRALTTDEIKRIYSGKG